MTSVSGSVEPVEKEVKVKESVTLGDKRCEKSTGDAVKGTTVAPGVPPARVKKIPIILPVAVRSPSHQIIIIIAILFFYDYLWIVMSRFTKENNFFLLEK
uniref:Tpx2 protein n=1 Tax=Fopius arisanus TaxID=64838 RepID=A0A0C9Q2K8_9HYME